MLVLALLVLLLVLLVLLLLLLSGLVGLWSCFFVVLFYVVSLCLLEQAGACRAGQRLARDVTDETVFI